MRNQPVPVAVREQVDRLTELLYQELRVIARARLRGRRPTRPLDVTELVNEAYVRLSERRSELRDNKHFLAFASLVMHRVIADHARAARAKHKHVTFVDQQTVFGAGSAIDALDLADLVGQLAETAPRLAQVVSLRFFMGLTVAETAEILKIDRTSVIRAWKSAQLILRRALSQGDERE